MSEGFSVSDALAPFRFKRTYRLQWGDHWIDIRRANMSNREFSAKVREHRKAIVDGLDAGGDYLTGSERGDMALCADVIIEGWSFPIPLDRAIEDVFALPAEEDPEEAGRELFYRIMEIARNKALFKVDSGDEADAKNSRRSSKPRRGSATKRAQS